MAKIAPISEELLCNISKVITNTGRGLTGTEISHLLANSNIPNTDPGITKWQRLFNAFAHWQNEHQCSNNIYDFLHRAMNPVSYMNNQETF